MDIQPQQAESKSSELSGHLRKILVSLSLITTVASAVSGLVETLRGLTFIVLSGIACCFAGALYLYISKARRSSLIFGIEQSRKYGKLWKISSLALLSITLLLLGFSIFQTIRALPGYPQKISIYFVNHTGIPRLRINREARFIITHPLTPVSDMSVTSGTMDIEPENGDKSAFDGQLIELKGASNNLVGKIRNAKRFKDLYQAGEYKIQVIFETEMGIYRTTENFRKGDFESMFVRIAN